ncbi:cell division protein SepF [Candidatus Woesearchaeota archaeon]|nr:cell division protein SepF [Candidatus Woesearchaeota archaeon]
MDQKWSSAIIDTGEEEDVGMGKGFFSQLKDKLAGPSYDEIENAEQNYVEIDTAREEGKSKITVRPFLLEDFEDVKPILDSLREGYTIALVNIRPLKDKDIVELKRAINKLKKTTDAIEGEIAGFGEDYIVVCPSFASIYRSKQVSEVKGEEGKAEE